MTLSPLLSRLWRAVLLGALIVTGHASFAEDVIEAKAKICATCHGEQGVPMQKAFPVIGGAIAKFRHDLKVFQTFEIHTRLIGWGSKWAVFEQRFVRKERAEKLGR